MRERKRERKRGSGGVCECERVRVCVCVCIWAERSCPQPGARRPDPHWRPAPLLSREWEGPGLAHSRTREVAPVLTAWALAALPSVER